MVESGPGRLKWVLEGAELGREGLVKCVAVKSQHRIDSLIGLAGVGAA